MKKCTYPKHVKKVPIQTPTKTRWKCGGCDHNFCKKEQLLQALQEHLLKTSFQYEI